MVICGISISCSSPSPRRRPWRSGRPRSAMPSERAAWVLQRVLAQLDRRWVGNATTPRAQLGLSLFEAFARIWLLAGAIIVAGVAGGRADGLAAALDDLRRVLGRRSRSGLLSGRHRSGRTGRPMNRSDDEPRPQDRLEHPARLRDRVARLRPRLRHQRSQKRKLQSDRLPFTWKPGSTSPDRSISTRASCICLSRRC